MKSRTDGGGSTGGRSTTPSIGNSACSRAVPPPVKNDCSVCAASWITRSPSIRPGQPRSRWWPLGLNMQSFIGRRILRARRLLRLRVDDQLRDLGALAADALLDLARAGVRLGQRHIRVE